MLWSVVILLAAAVSVESYSVHDTHERLAHGRQLKIYLPKSSEKLEFTPAYEPEKTFVYWERGRNRMNRGRVSGTGNDRRWYVDKVTYEDQGTYTQTDYWNKEISTVKVAVIPRRHYAKCLAGSSLLINLEGIELIDASLIFSVDNINTTLVHAGAPVAQDLPDYWNRVKTHSLNIEIKHVNFSDEGHYTLKDRKDRVVSVTRMDLTDEEVGSGNPLLGLLLLLGIPAGICCCCRKKIFKKKPPTGAVLQTSPDAVHPPPSGPAGPCPPYNAPGQPGEQPGAMNYYNPNSNVGPAVYPPPPAGPGQWNGPPPSPGFNPAYPPPNAAPVMPPGQPPQWPYPAQGQYPPAPMGYSPTPVMYSAPPEEGIKMGNMATTAADPLLTSAPEGEAASSPVAPVAPVAPSSNDGPTANDNAYKFQIDGDKSSSNFL